MGIGQVRDASRAGGLQGDEHIEVLGWVNRQRMAAGRDPIDALPRGRPCDPGGCPVSLGVGAGPIGPELDHQGRRLPAAVRQFLAAFDLGLLPEYEQDAGQPWDPAPSQARSRS